MNNPIFSNFNNFSNQQQPYQNNSLINAMNQISQSKNPQQTVQEMLLRNPNFKEIVSYINQNGGDARSAFYNMAAQKGIDPNTILSKLKY